MHFKHLVQCFKVRVKVLISEPDGTSTVLVDYNPFSTGEQKLKTLVSADTLSDCSPPPDRDTGELSRKRRIQEVE